MNCLFHDAMYAFPEYVFGLQCTSFNPLAHRRVGGGSQRASSTVSTTAVPLVQGGFSETTPSQPIYFREENPWLLHQRPSVVVVIVTLA